jgi:hypothetical protein
VRAKGTRAAAGREERHEYERQRDAQASAVVVVLERLIADMTPVGINTFHIRAGAVLVLRAKTALDEWRPLAEDETGETWR